MKTNKRIAASLAVILGVLVGSIALTAAPASASAYVCANSHGLAGATCMYVRGESDYVNDVRVQHDDGYSFTNICGYRAYGRYTTRSGTVINHYSATHSGCSLFSGERLLVVNSYMQNPSYLTTQFYHDGAWAPGVPRATISR